MGCRPGLKLCLLVTSILFILLIIASTILFFVVLKPKEPKITTKSVTLDRIDYSIFPKPYLNLTLNIVVEVENPNYGNFRYDDSNAYLLYRGGLVGVSPIPAGYSKARSTEVIRSNVTLMTGKFLEDVDFYGDLLDGVMNFTSTSSLHGQASMFKILKAEITSNLKPNSHTVVSTSQIQSDFIIPSSKATSQTTKLQTPYSLWVTLSRRYKTCIAFRSSKPEKGIRISAANLSRKTR